MLEIELESVTVSVKILWGQVQLNQYSALTLLLFIIVLGALSREISSGCSEELFHTDELALLSHLKFWKEDWKGCRKQEVSWCCLQKGCRHQFDLLPVLQTLGA